MTSARISDAALDRLNPRRRLHQVVVEYCAERGLDLRTLSIACGYAPHTLAAALTNESKFTDELAHRVAETMLALAGGGWRSR